MEISIKDFGAKPNSGELQTEKIQAAIDHCYKNGGGEVVVPCGEYIVGGIRLRSGITLRLKNGAKLKGSKNIGDYKIIFNDTIDSVPEDFLPEHKTSFGRKYWFNALILIYNEKDVAIIGEENSFIDGSNCYNPDGEEHYRGPHALTVLKSENIAFKNYTVVDSGNWSHNMWLCKNITCENVSVLAGHDGIDFFGSENVIVKNCTFYTGDDCIAGYDNKNVVIENCMMNSSCSALRFCGTDVLVENCTIQGPGKYVHRYSLSETEKKEGANPAQENIDKYRHNMHDFFTYYADKRLVFKNKPSNILIRNCTISDCDRFFYYDFTGREKWQTNMPLYDITFERVTVKNLIYPLNIYGDNDVKVALTINDSQIDFKKDCGEIPFILAANFSKISLKNVSTNLKGNALAEVWDGCGEIEVTGGNVSERFENIKKRSGREYKSAII